MPLAVPADEDAALQGIPSVRNHLQSHSPETAAGGRLWSCCPSAPCCVSPWGGQWREAEPPALLPGRCVLAHAASLARGCLQPNRYIFFLMNIILKLLRMYVFYFFPCCFSRIFVITQPALFLPRKGGIKTRVSHLLLDCTNPFL